MQCLPSAFIQESSLLTCAVLCTAPGTGSPGGPQDALGGKHCEELSRGGRWGLGGAAGGKAAAHTVPSRFGVHFVKGTLLHVLGKEPEALPGSVHELEMEKRAPLSQSPLRPCRKCPEYTGTRGSAEKQDAYRKSIPTRVRRMFCN